MEPYTVTLSSGETYTMTETEIDLHPVLYCNSCEIKKEHNIADSKIKCNCGQNYMCGVLEYDMLLIGIKQEAAKKIQTDFWKMYDEFYPPTTYERGMTLAGQGKDINYVTSMLLLPEFINDFVRAKELWKNQ